MAGRKSADDRCACSAGPVQRADLVAGRIAQVGEIEFACRTLAPTGRILDALAAVGDASVVEGLHLLGAVTGEADGAAVGVCRDLAVNRFGDAEHASLGPIEDATLRIGLALRHANCAERGVVELLGCGDILAPTKRCENIGTLLFRAYSESFARTSLIEVLATRSKTNRNDPGPSAPATSVCLALPWTQATRGRELNKAASMLDSIHCERALRDGPRPDRGHRHSRRPAPNAWFEVAAVGDDISMLQDARKLGQSLVDERIRW